MKDFFQKEIDRAATPPFPGKGKPAGPGYKDVLAIAACLLVILTGITRPSLYETEARILTVSHEQWRSAGEEFDVFVETTARAFQKKANPRRDSP